MVTHGRANSLMEALSFGVPLLVSPLFNDQPHNAEFVVRSGAGLRLDLERATPGECRQALRVLLGVGPIARQPPGSPRPIAARTAPFGRPSSSSGYTLEQTRRRPAAAARCVLRPAFGVVTDDAPPAWPP